VKSWPGDVARLVGAKEEDGGDDVVHFRRNDRQGFGDKGLTIPLDKPLWISVLIKPGATAFDRFCWRAHSRAVTFVSATTLPCSAE